MGSTNRKDMQGAAVAKVSDQLIGIRLHVADDHRADDDRRLAILRQACGDRVAETQPYLSAPSRQPACFHLAVAPGRAKHGSHTQAAQPGPLIEFPRIARDRQRPEISPGSHQ